jgi:acyl carrier protein
MPDAAAADITLRTLTVLSVYSGIALTGPDPDGDPSSIDSQSIPTAALSTLGFDSLETISVIQELESEFNIIIPESDIERLETIGQLVGYITERVANK